MIEKNRYTKMIGTLSLLLVMLAGPLTLMGCNTVAGVGEDLEAAGDAIEDKAEEKKRY